MKNLVKNSAILGMLLTSVSWGNAQSAKIISLNEYGSGCLPGNTHTVAADFSSVEFGILEAIHPASPQEHYKICQFSMNVSVPNGYEYAIGSFDWEADININADQRAVFTFTEYVQGNPTSTKKYSKEFSGPTNLLHSGSKADLTSNLVWSGCERRRNFNLKMAVELLANRGANATASASINKIENIKLITRPCN